MEIKRDLLGINLDGVSPYWGRFLMISYIRLNAIVILNLVIHLELNFQKRYNDNNNFIMKKED
jgi:hypothetical protein